MYCLRKAQRCKAYSKESRNSKVNPSKKTSKDASRCVNALALFTSVGYESGAASLAFIDGLDDGLAAAAILEAPAASRPLKGAALFQHNEHSVTG